MSCNYRIIADDETLERDTAAAADRAADRLAERTGERVDIYRVHDSGRSELASTVDPSKAGGPEASKAGGPEAIGHRAAEDERDASDGEPIADLPDDGHYERLADALAHEPSPADRAAFEDGWR